MPPAYPQLTSHLEQTNTDGYLINADGEDSNQYYLSGYHAPDNFVTLYANDSVSLLVSGLEYTRAKSDSNGDAVRKLSEFGYWDKAEEVDPRKAGKLVTADFLAESGIESVSVPDSFPVSTADVLREHGIDVVWDDEYVLKDICSVKSKRKIHNQGNAAGTNEDAMAVAKDLLERATVENVILYLDDEVPTSEIRYGNTVMFSYKRLLSLATKMLCMNWKAHVGKWLPDLFREPDGGYRFFIGVAVGTIFAAVGLFWTGQDFLLFFLGSFLATLSLAEVPFIDRTWDAGILRAIAIICLTLSVVVFIF